MTNCLQARLPTGETNMKTIVSHFLETADQRRKGKKVHLKCWSGASQCSTAAIFSIFTRTFGIALFLVLGNIQMKRKSSGDYFKDNFLSLLNSKFCFSRAWGTDGFLFFLFFFLNLNLPNLGFRDLSFHTAPADGPSTYTVLEQYFCITPSLPKNTFCCC